MPGLIRNIMAKRIKKVDSKEVGLEIGLHVFKFFLGTEYLHYGYFVDGLEPAVANLKKAQENYAEMVGKSGQPLSPCVEIDGIMLADVSGEEVEEYMLKNNLVQNAVKDADSPTDRGCSDEEHDRMREQQSQPVRFF